jgi:hypothetical protein
MTGMKITVDAAMRARDVSQPAPTDVLPGEDVRQSNRQQAQRPEPERRGPAGQAPAVQAQRAELPDGQERDAAAGQRPRPQPPSRPAAHRRARLRRGQPI